MKTNNLKLMFAIFILFYLILFINKNSFAFVPPEGCNADSYVAYSSNGIVHLDFYEGASVACNYDLAGNYQNQAINEVQSLNTDYTDLVKYLIYALFGMMTAFVLFVAIYIVNS